MSEQHAKLIGDYIEAIKAAVGSCLAVSSIEIGWNCLTDDNDTEPQIFPTLTMKFSDVPSGEALAKGEQ